MNKNKQYKIALVLYTQGLDYDDRIRKEMLSVMKLYPNVSFKIFAVEPKNREEDGVTSYGVPYHIPYLKSRDKYPSASHTLAKALDFYKSVKKELRTFDALWCADIETFPFVLLTRGMPILWDHHELPGRFMGKTMMRSVYKYMERKCKVVIHANQPRLDYMNSKALVSDVNKHFVLRNYPDFNEIDVEYDDMYHRFEQWLGDGKCVYLQGINTPARADIESLGAILQFNDLKAVVVGRISDERRSLMEAKFGTEILAERVFFTGVIKQLKTPQYIRKCYLSLVFYKHTSPNNWYCEPNRLFQSVINGVPVVVGNNPPLEEFVNKYEVGVVANTDGSDEISIMAAVRKAAENYGQLKQQADKLPADLLWSSQEKEIEKVVDKFLS